jgi:hypothetical protein
MAVEQLTAIGWGLTMFAIIVGLGLVVLTKLGSTVAACGTGYTFNTFNNTCQNASGYSVDPANTAWTTVNYVATQMGSTGLAGWIPVIIVVLIAGLVLALLGGKKNY